MALLAFKSGYMYGYVSFTVCLFVNVNIGIYS